MLARRILMLVALMGLAGCQSWPQALPVATVPVAPLAPTARQMQWPDLNSVPTPSGMASSKITNTANYFNLTAEECRARACQEAGLAKLIQQSAHVQRHPHSATHHVEEDALRFQLANHLSREVRNRSAGAALDLYYRLLEAELLSEVLDESQKEVDELLGISEKLIKSGMKETPETDTLRKQQIDLRADRARLQAGIARLNAELKGLLKQDHLEGNLLPADTIQIPAEALEADTLVQVGLNQRADLHALRELIHRLSPETVTLIKQAIAQVLPPLGALQVVTRTFLPGLHNLLPALHGSADVSQMRNQLQSGLKYRETEAERDIRSAVAEWLSQRELVAIAKQRMEFEAQRIKELEVLKKAGKPVELELRKARLERLKAVAEMVRESAKWKRADVKARQEMGILCPMEACNQ